MKVIRSREYLFKNLIPIIREEEAKGLRFLFHRDDGSYGYFIRSTIHFDDGKSEVTFEDRVLDPQ